MNWLFNNWNVSIEVLLSAQNVPQIQKIHAIYGRYELMKLSVEELQDRILRKDSRKMEVFDWYGMERAIWSLLNKGILTKMYNKGFPMLNKLRILFVFGILIASVVEIILEFYESSQNIEQKGLKIGWVNSSAGAFFMSKFAWKTCAFESLLRKNDPYTMNEEIHIMILFQHRLKRINLHMARSRNSITSEWMQNTHRANNL